MGLFLETIYLSEENPNFKYLDESKNIIIGKSNLNNDNYDTIVFGSRSVYEITIPSTIKRIECCQSENELKTIKFEGKSTLETIQKNAFSNGQQEISIPKNFTIPPSVKYVGCIGSLSVNVFHKIVSPFNSNFKYIDDSMILGKSDPDNDVFDIILSARLDIKKAVIPSYIKYIYIHLPLIVVLTLKPLNFNRIQI